MGALVNPYAFGAGTPPDLGLPHVWWRLRFTAIQGVGVGGGADRAAAKRIIFYEMSAGKPRAIITAPAETASSPNNTGSAANGVDVASLTTGAPGYWDSVDTTSMFLARRDATEKTVIGVGIIGLGDGTKFSPLSFVVESSDNGSAWTTEFTVSGIPAWPEADTLRVWFLPSVTYTGSPWGAHVHWRCTVIDTLSNSLRAAELEWRATPGGVDQAEGSGGTGNQSNQWASQAPALAYDSNTTTYAETVSDTAYQDYMGYQFTVAKSVASVGWMSQDTTHNPIHGLVSYSDDGTAWYPAWGWSLQSWASGGVMLFFTDPLYV